MTDVVRVLGIETSCDETAASVVCDGKQILSTVLSSQIAEHVPYGGVVPEVASRAHVELLQPIISRALVEAGFAHDDKPEAVAATVGPGLVGALLVGLSAAKALALVWDVPFVAVNHLDAHLWASSLEEENIEYPLVMLLVSGGHTMLVLCRAPGQYEVLGQTRDDAVGEAFDKVGRAMGLGYPGGPVIDRLSGEGNPLAVDFPRAMPGDNYEFSFSGVKTAVANHLRKNPDYDTADVAASFQAAVVDQLLGKTRRAAEQFGAKGICLAGGVAANSSLREKTCDIGIDLGISVMLPSRSMCTDNAAMVAAAGFHRLRENGPSPMNVGAQPSLGLNPPHLDERRHLG